MRQNISRLILIVADLLVIYASMALAYYTREMLQCFFDIEFNKPLEFYTHFMPLYIIVFVVFFYEGIYTKRYDFWHESRQVIKSLIFSFLLTLSFLAFTKSNDLYSRAVFVFCFFYMMLFIPLFKNIVKKILFRMGLWHLDAKVYGADASLKKEIFHNPYLGYVASDDTAKTVFINSKSFTPKELRDVIAKEMLTKHEVIFIPFVNEYNLIQSHIYELSNSRINLIVFRNELKSRFRVWLQNILNYLFALFLTPFVLPLIAIFAILIKRESKGPVFFVHNRVGQHGKIIPTLKFRSMYSDAKERLEKLLEEDEAMKEEWEKSFKLRNDPRITKIGRFLRKTSLDELPQIFNVLKGQMNFVGPRPVLQKELDMYYKEDAQYYLMVKPGITGLWQVSGRSDTDYPFRVATDKWYVQNWSLWLDTVILIKTVRVVLFRDGAY
jgi:lipopolysaccharide/colanic/teichoic acid biosynthesis glycosyltransferase